MKKNEVWITLVLGCLITGGSAYGLLTIDDGYYRHGVYVPIWGNWLLLPVGLIIMIIAIRAILRGEAKPIPYSDEELAKAKAELDALYLREHGELPQKPKPEKTDA